MSSESASPARRRHRWTVVTVSAVAAVALAFYIGSFFIGHFMH